MTIRELKELIINMKDDDLVMIQTEEDTDVVGDYWLSDVKDRNGVQREVIVFTL